MDREMAYDFFQDVENALDNAFDDCFWSIETEVFSDEANIYITINYEDVPEYLEDDIFTEIEDALDDLEWEFSADWQDNVYEITISDDDDMDD